MHKAYRCWEAGETVSPVGEVISGVTFACDSAAAIEGMYLNVGLVLV